MTRITEYELAKVRWTAGRFCHRMRRVSEREELIAIGNLALVESDKRFKKSFGVTFWTFAQRRVVGAMQDHLRKLDFMTRNDRKSFKSTGILPPVKFPWQIGLKILAAKRKGASCL
jgi:DNA-directed RNA polymerase specialized sigma subunit